MSTMDAATGAASNAAAAMSATLRVRHVPSTIAAASTASETSGRFSPSTRIQPDAPMAKAVNGFTQVEGLRRSATEVLYASGVDAGATGSCGAKAATVRFGSAFTVA